MTPVLIYPDVRAAVAWLETAFGFEERVRIGEAHRSQLGVGQDGAVIVAESGGQKVPPTAGSATHVIKIRVPDVDAAFGRAREAGARVMEEPTSHALRRAVLQCGGPGRSPLGTDPDRARCRARGVGRHQRHSVVTRSAPAPVPSERTLMPLSALGVVPMSGRSPVSILSRSDGELDAHVAVGVDREVGVHFLPHLRTVIAVM